MSWNTRGRETLPLPPGLHAAPGPQVQACQVTKASRKDALVWHPRGQPEGQPGGWVLQSVCRKTREDSLGLGG